MKKLIMVLGLLFILAGVHFAQEPVTFFNGVDGPWFEWYDFWGGSLPNVDGVLCKYADEGTGPTGNNSIKWVMDSTECGFAWAWWSSWNKFDYRDLFNGGYLSIWLRVPANVDTIKLEFKTDDTKRMHYYLTSTNALFDDEWHQYKIPFKNWLTPPPGLSLPIDSTNVVLFGLYTGKGTRGAVVYIGEVSANPRDPIVFFDGQTDPANSYSYFGFWGSNWGAGSGIEAGAGYESGKSALKWMQDVGWGSCGISWVFTQKPDFTERMKSDTLKLKIRLTAPTDSISIEINSDKEHATGYIFKPENNLDWQIYNIPLDKFKVSTGKSAPDYTQINEFGIFSVYPNDGLVIYLTDIWIGNPVLEVDSVAPASPQNITIDLVKDKYNYNLIKWADVPDEENEKYNVYYSKNPITDVEAEGVQVLAEDVAEYKGEVGVNHYFFTPKVETPTTFYYAVTCVDKANNVSAPGLSNISSNPSNGVAVINDGAPVLFMADGDLSEWIASGIKPFIISKSRSVVPEGSFFDNDDDLTVKLYLAVDDYNLYVGVDAIDDKVVFDITGEWNKQDIIYLHLGLYNQVGEKHDGATTTTLRATEPDYVFYLMGDKIMKRALGAWDFRDMFKNGTDNYNVVQLTANSFYSEAMIPLDSIPYEGDARFHPAKGMKIPFEVVIDDRDDNYDPDGALAFSPYYNGWSWSSPYEWAETWISDTTTTDVHTAVPVVREYKLGQNYPNPFNPSTTINYSLEKTGVVKIKVYDLLGKEVTTLVNDIQSAGYHSVNFDITKNSNLTSGFYIYQIQSGSFRDSKKMLLLK